VIDAAPGRVLRLSLLAWGLGHLALGRRSFGATLIIFEAICLGIVTLTTLLYTDGTWYLVPFVAGCAFIAIWAFQAVLAYRRALRRGDAIPPPPRRSPAAVTAWLTLPLLAWGTGFWLIAAEAASPASVLDRYLEAWPSPARLESQDDLADDPAALAGAAAQALDHLAGLCANGELESDCADAAENLLRDVRLRVESESSEAASAVAELVRFERRPTRFLGVFEASELVPVPVEEILRIDLAARPGAFGSERWTIVEASVP
jgi:hypothetical protein